MRGRKPATDISTTRTRPRTPKAMAERKAAEHLAGRVFKNKPAPDNLEVPPHMYLSDTKLLIGEDKKA